MIIIAVKFYQEHEYFGMAACFLWAIFFLIGMVFSLYQSKPRKKRPTEVVPEDGDIIEV